MKPVSVPVYGVRGRAMEAPLHGCCRADGGRRTLGAASAACSRANQHHLHTSRADDVGHPAANPASALSTRSEHTLGAASAAWSHTKQFHLHTSGADDVGHPTCEPRSALSTRTEHTLSAAHAA